MSDCKTCAEYDSDKGYCPKYCEVIQKTLDERTRWIPVSEVVRCKDCEFYTEEERWCRRLGLCGAFNDDDFCSHGERRDDER